MKLHAPLIALALIAGSASLALAQGAGNAPSSGHSSGASTSSGNNPGSATDPSTPSKGAR
ncbi:hypothetical protein U8607_05205 [Methylobacterium durans]|uniref:Uncharacterized protein n=1 Tax=Methylobacterium durans TaxID=2202825 RepID=A0A2U8W5C1_9HYPH|nr:hypothetical protein [Methylobacterium durans]AWN40831.1 hypothetical protein DK389_10200 [Methylobacterium durans]MEA1831476.1 hypothetical protein [Methylobacterium durans]